MAKKEIVVTFETYDILNLNESDEKSLIDFISLVSQIGLEDNTNKENYKND